MSKTPALSIYESTFAQSDKTDVILIVEGKKLRVSKTVLSFHSDYFDALFNADFMEISMPEISIEDVNFEDFAAVLSLILKNPISPTEENAEKLLELSDRFLLPAAKRHVEFFLISVGFGAYKKLELASRYDSDTLLTHALELFKTKEELVPKEEFSGFSEKVKAKILDRLIELNKPKLSVPTGLGSGLGLVGRLNPSMSSKSTRPLLKFPIDIRAHVLYDAYQRISNEKSYKNYEKLCIKFGKQAISFEEYESLFNQYLEVDERELPDIRGCILSDVTNGKSAEKSIDDLCDAFKNHKIDKEDHGYWYKRFENGQSFTRVTFSNFPEDVISEIVERCDMKSYLNLRKVSHALRAIVDHLAPPCTVIGVKCGHCWIKVSVDDTVIADSLYFEKTKSKLPLGLIEKLSPKTVELLLRNPKLRLKSFEIVPYPYVQSTWMKTRTGIVIPPLNHKKRFFDLLNSLDHKIHAEKCVIKVDNEKEVIKVLQCFKPGTLKELEISTGISMDGITEVVKMDQWKLAKHLKMNTFVLPSIENFFHFPSFELGFPPITLEDMVKLCENASISNTFEHCKVIIQGIFELETIKRALNLQPTSTEQSFSIPNTNLIVQYLSKVMLSRVFKIYKN
ncbi:hypothetical protein GCK72_021209 [Caenorhabditis remanei]|nr:hypothetical protein GCK72_021209 [Caenorhabditis remanei]KAF1754646.1 hypothetical protein GCK72_021209 [Caenorhabditis remanei]